MIKNIWFWIKASRVYSLPMAILSCLVASLFAYFDGGNLVLGFIAFIGIFLCQMATNLFDDYLDFRSLIKNPEIKEKKFKNVHKNKASFLVNGEVSLNQVLSVVIIYCLLACICGVIILYYRGLPIVWLSLIGAVLVLFYSFFSKIGLSELAVAIAFGPLLFEGVYFVMTGYFSFEILLISIAVVAFTVGLLYTHTVLDFDMDMDSHKKTLACRMKDKHKSLHLLTFFLAIGYLTILFMVIFKILSPIFLITWLTLPLALELYYSLKLYNDDKFATPDKHFWHYPMENVSSFKEKGVESFMFRFYQSRNLMIYFSILVCIAKIVTELK